jgi:hypothetical protein
MQSAQTAKVTMGLTGFTDLALMAMIKDAAMHLADTQKRVAMLQAEMDRRIAAGDTQLKEEFAQAGSPAPAPPASKPE